MTAEQTRKYKNRYVVFGMIKPVRVNVIARHIDPTDIYPELHFTRKYTRREVSTE